MSILIKNMEMPSACYKCNLCSIKVLGRYEAKLICRVSGEEIAQFEGKRDDCPLIELPPHGRLIDADALTEDGWKLYKRVEYKGYSAIHEMPLICPSIPTIIEAERVDEEM